MDEMLALEEERMERMRENREGEGTLKIGDGGGAMKTAEDEGIIRRELSRADPSAAVFSESWAAKKVGFVFRSCFCYSYILFCSGDLSFCFSFQQSRIRQASPYGHLGMFLYH